MSTLEKLGIGLTASDIQQMTATNRTENSRPIELSYYEINREAMRRQQRAYYLRRRKYICLRNKRYRHEKEEQNNG